MDVANSQYEKAPEIFEITFGIPAQQGRLGAQGVLRLGENGFFGISARPGGLRSGAATPRGEEPLPARRPAVSPSTWRIIDCSRLRVRGASGRQSWW